MASVVESKKLVENIVRLRQAQRVPDVARDLAFVRRDLESRLGPTLSRSRASRILGVSQTAFDRWVAAGQIPTVVTPAGRLEVPRQFVVEMAELIEELKRKGERRHPLSAALHRRRSNAEGIRDSIASRRRRPPRGSRLPRGRRTAEERSLAYHQIVAERLNERLVDEARQRVEALARERHMHPRYQERWQELLSRPIPEIAEAITRDDQEGHDLRQNTPFAGVLNEQERRQIIEVVR